jgi:hypothetical protein
MQVETLSNIHISTILRPDYKVEVITAAPGVVVEKKPFVKPPLIRSNARLNLFNKYIPFNLRSSK